jgi:hypothetical protein
MRYKRTSLGGRTNYSIQKHRLFNGLHLLVIWVYSSFSEQSDDTTSYACQEDQLIPSLEEGKCRISEPKRINRLHLGGFSDTFAPARQLGIPVLVCAHVHYLIRFKVIRFFYSGSSDWLPRSGQATMFFIKRRPAHEITSPIFGAGHVLGTRNIFVLTHHYPLALRPRWNLAIAMRIQQ